MPSEITVSYTFFPPSLLQEMHLERQKNPVRQCEKGSGAGKSTLLHDGRIAWLLETPLNPESGEERRLI